MENELHLWHINLLPYFQLDPSDSLLNDFEKARTDRYLFKKHRQRSSTCRKLLKLILASYLNEEATSVVIKTRQHGKPYISNTSLRFNLSHSGDYLFLGLSKNNEIGVDIEQIKDRDFLGLARHSFSFKESKSVQDAKEAQRAEIFYKIWCQKEAFIKLDGRGLRYPLKDFSVSIDNTGGLTESLQNQWPVLSCYQSVPNMFAAYCMDVPDIQTHFFDNKSLEENILAGLMP